MEYCDMKICTRCYKEFEEGERHMSTAEKLADIFLKDIGVEDINDLCPHCKEELGILNLFGFE